VHNASVWVCMSDLRTHKLDGTLYAHVHTSRKLWLNKGLYRERSTHELGGSLYANVHTSRRSIRLREKSPIRELLQMLQETLGNQATV